MNKKKILIVISTLSGGGAERIASILGTELNKRDYEVHFLTFYDSAEYDFEGKYHTLDECMKTSIFSKGKKLFSRAYKIAKYCKKNNIDVCLSHMPEANFPSILGKIFHNDLKVIVSIHCNPEKQPKSFRFLIKHLYPHADLNICVSKAIEKKINRVFGINNTKTIYNMQQIEESIKLSKKKMPQKYKNIFKNKFNFITVGRLTKQKGQWHLIRAFKKVNEEEPNTNLIIVGDGELKENLKKLIKCLNLEDNVFLLGFQDNIFSFLNRSDCFVLSSLWEGMGIVLTEALSVNLPIISTDCDFGPREIIGPTLEIDAKIDYPYYGQYGILVKTPKEEFNFKNLKQEKLDKEEKMMAQEMIKIIKNKQLRKKYSKGLIRAKDFNVKNIIKQWEKII